MGLDDFFARLAANDVEHAVLRWFDGLPAVEPDEDVDILVADEDLPFVHTLLVDQPAGLSSQKFDVYSVSGLPGSDFREIPYYPPSFARELLATAVPRPGGHRVPDPLHHFRSLAYHAVYHKGYASGLAAEPGAPGDPALSDHDYAAVLAGLAADLGLDVAPDLASLDEHLHEHGLRPPLDALERLRPGNPWIRDRFFSAPPEIDEVWSGLAVFVVRDRAADRTAEIVEQLDRQGFEVLDTVVLDPEQRDLAGRGLRGGNWERGPFPLSGGAPAAFVIAYDVAPRLRPGDPWWGANQRIPAAKADVRTHLLATVGEERRYNPLHSSDNPAQAVDYLAVLGGAEFSDRLEKKVRDLLDACAVPFPVLRPLAPGGLSRRARVYAVDHPVHGESVCKVFRPGAARYHERELRARTELGDLPLVPELLDHGPNWVLTPMYRDDRSHVQRSLPLTRGTSQLRPGPARALARFAADLHERGMFVLDLAPQNLVTDPWAGLRVLDLEFLQDDREPGRPVEASYTFRGIPAELADRYDQPDQVLLVGDGVGNPAFHPAVTGLPVEALLGPPRPVDAVRRAVTQLAWAGWLLGARPVRIARRRMTTNPTLRRFRRAGVRFVAARRRGRA
ncbi:hypothetical protein [Pseudonocardia lacus]|uniref:hypothetical protein n=1 Tax=Pseudonocardia lacus TaxID=2835865 RepID=UPI001BDD9ABE|nr:hypothetical protein [Pseudonocardia lacus]